jgi:hypothetical protein
MQFIPSLFLTILISCQNYHLHSNYYYFRYLIFQAFLNFFSNSIRPPIWQFLLYLFLFHFFNYCYFIIFSYLTITMSAFISMAITSIINYCFLFFLSYDCFLNFHIPYFQSKINCFPSQMFIELILLHHHQFVLFIICFILNYYPNSLLIVFLDLIFFRCCFKNALIC